MQGSRMSTDRRHWRKRRVSFTNSCAELFPQRVTLMSKSATVRQVAFRGAAAISGIALLGCLIWRFGPGSLLENISTLGWGLVLIVALGGVAHLVKTWAWRLTLTGGRGGG